MHCWGGVGRTGLVVACWLQEHGRTPAAALAELSEKWRTVKKSVRKRESPETQTQVDWVTGTCFDIGVTVRKSLESYLRSGEPFAGSTDPFTAGNGSLMRLAPVPLAFRRNVALAIHNAGESSRTTHGAITAVDACRYFAGLLLGALEGRSKEDLLSSFFCPAPDRDYWHRYSLTPEIAEIANGSFKQRKPPEIIGSGFVVRSLEAALWAFYRSDSFRGGALRAVNLGDDAQIWARPSTADFQDVRVRQNRGVQRAIWQGRLCGECVGEGRIFFVAGCTRYISFI